MQQPRTALCAIDRMLQRLFEIGNQVACIADEYLVPALTSEHNFHRFGRQLRNVKLRNKSRSGDWLVHHVHQPRQQRRKLIAGHIRFVVASLDALGNGASVNGFVERGPS